MQCMQAEKIRDTKTVNVCTVHIVHKFYYSARVQTIELCGVVRWLLITEHSIKHYTIMESCGM